MELEEYMELDSNITAHNYITRLNYIIGLRIRSHEVDCSLEGILF